MRIHRSLVLVLLALPLVAAGITVTPERAKRVAFSDPYLTDVREVVVGQGDAPPVTATSDLSGKRVHVVRGSSYERSLVRVNDELRAAGLEPVIVERAPPYIEAEDLLELVDDGLIEYTVVDEHVAEVWSSVLDGLAIYDAVPLREGGSIAWAVRKEDTQLQKSLSEFARTRGRGSMLGNVLFRRYFDDTGWITGTARSVPERIEDMRRIAQQHADEYDFDWVLLAAVALQESRLQQDARSSAGAVGVFQIKPEVARQEVGVENPYALEENILAGIRYLARIRDTYLDDPALDPVQRTDLMLASYNAGPNRIRRLRQLAAEKGYDGDVWFGNVDRFAPQEARTYVASINRMYYSFRLGLRALDAREMERDSIR